MRFAALFLVWITSALAQSSPGPIVFTVVGSLSCGLRQLGGGQVQMWCFAGADRKLIFNAMDDTSATPANAELYEPAAAGTGTYPEADGGYSKVAWFVYYGMQYQIVATRCSPDPDAGRQRCNQQPVQTGVLQ